MGLPVFDQFEGEALTNCLLSWNAGTVAKLAIHGRLQQSPLDIASAWEATADQLPAALPDAADVAHHLKTQADYLRSWPAAPQGA